jgi:hypothetical protein
MKVAMEGDREKGSFPDRKFQERHSSPRGGAWMHRKLQRSPWDFVEEALITGSWRTTREFLPSGPMPWGW